MSAYGLARPHPDHQPHLLKANRGRSQLTGRTKYGTALRCSCGTLRVTVSTDPPSKARPAAADAYRLHLQGLGIEVLA